MRIELTQTLNPSNLIHISAYNYLVTSQINTLQLFNNKQL